MELFSVRLLFRLVLYSFAIGLTLNHVILDLGVGLFISGGHDSLIGLLLLVLLE